MGVDNNGTAMMGPPTVGPQHWIPIIGIIGGGIPHLDVAPPQRSVEVLHCQLPPPGVLQELGAVLGGEEGWGSTQSPTDPTVPPIGPHRPPIDPVSPPTIPIPPPTFPIDPHRPHSSTHRTPDSL